MTAPSTFAPVLDTTILLPAALRGTLTRWLDGRPVTPAGEPVIGVAEEISIRPAEYYTSKATDLLLGAETCIFRRVAASPICLSADGPARGLDLEEAMADWMRPYRDVYFELQHCLFEGVIQDSEVKVLTAGRGRIASLVHLRDASILIDEEELPASITQELLSAEPDPSAGEGLVTVFPHYQLNSAHGRMAFLQALPRLNQELLAAWIAGGDHPEALLPRQLAAGDLPRP